MPTKHATAPSADRQALLRAIPATDRCLDRLEALIGQDDRQPLPRELQPLASAPRPFLREAVVAYWNSVRRRILEGSLADPAALDLEKALPALARFAARAVAPRLQPVLNGTGVVIHTNTGRSVLARQAQEALIMAACGNTTLEFDRESGGRGSRNALVGELLSRLTGAEDALVVNNNAAAVLLTLDTFCRGHEVVISRGELVEIGGSFRIPDVMESTGVHLREVGATNRTHLEDYERAISDETRAIVRVHTSNFRIIGFHSAVPTASLADLAHGRGLLFINDLGSGSLTDFAAAGLPDEPTVQQVVAEGADLVLFSGDKLLGGPQAGIIVGRRDLVARLRKNPLLRALRCDKLAYAALEATLRLYAEPERARREIPTLRRILLSPGELEARAGRLEGEILGRCAGLVRTRLVQDSSRTGGGAFPEYPLPTTLVALEPVHVSATALKKALLHTSPIVVGRLEEQAFCLDPRTLEPDDFPLLADLVSCALQGLSPAGGAGTRS